MDTREPVHSITLDPTQPADMQRLVNSGTIWTVASHWASQAIHMLVDDRVNATPAALIHINKLPGLLEHINELRNQSGRPPLGPDTTPATVAPDQLGQPVMDSTQPNQPEVGGTGEPPPTEGSVQPNQPEAGSA